ncbi:MAG TPA: hypothetical protein V6D11_20110 [Waterburya sp.]
MSNKRVSQGRSQLASKEPGNRGLGERARGISRLQKRGQWDTCGLGNLLEKHVPFWRRPVLPSPYP